jgi:hypothetical protein
VPGPDDPRRLLTGFAVVIAVELLALLALLRACG